MILTERPFNPYFGAILEERRNFVDGALKSYISTFKSPSEKLTEAVNYTLFAGGKRIRPALLISVCESLGIRNEGCLKAGCAFEALHTYSLIHDDLPSMDNDDFRRGKPTCHKVYGEALAILAGDALQALAFEWMSDIAKLGISEKKTIMAISIFSKAAGRIGMVGGQALDLHYEGKPVTLETLKAIHLLKTGAILKACVEVGAIIAGYPEEQINLFSAFGEKIGLLFQIVDDILDQEGTLSQLGKTPGKDLKTGKATFPSLIGLEESKKYATQIENEALEALSKIKLIEPLLLDFTRFIRSRIS
ncbi:MAG: polyprenyl synthetase family protein [Candidatus Riflebacteria bacterium]|nr:polyprenyl synthetase family protein [Candidatus Riflebacteria bacterium]